MLRLLTFLLPALLLIPPAARAQDHVRFGLDWRAEAEYGGYYQAVATGLYAKRGLDVAIVQGGPQLNQAQLLLAGRLDLNIASNAYLPLDMAAGKLPITAVAAIFQKDPTILLAHPGQHHDSFESLKGAPILIGAASRLSWWNFLKARFGYTDAQLRTYTFNMAPFLADPTAVQQGYLGSEPFLIKQQAGFDPVVLLLADAGFDGYASLITARNDYIEAHADIVQRFLDASIEGWNAYLYGDPAPADALIRKDNPEMSPELLAYGRDVLRQRGILDSGDATAGGIGTMTDARWQRFFESLVAQKLYPASLDWHAAYTTRFIGKGVGTAMRPK